MAGASYTSLNKVQSTNTTLNQLNSSLTSSVSSLNSFASSANNATSLSTYNTYKAKWDSEKAKYDSLLSQYNALGEVYDEQIARYGTLSKAEATSVTITDIPNFKDENQWRAGGFLKNQIYAGGVLYNPTTVHAPEEKPSNDEIYSMLNGSMLSVLNVGFQEIQKDIHGFDFLDLFREYRDLKVSVYNIVVSVTNANGDTQTSTHTIEGEGNSFELNNLSNEYSEYVAATPADWHEIFNARGLNLFSTDLINSFIQITIEEISTGKLFESPSMTIRNFVASTVVNTNLTLVTNQITMGIAKTFSMKSAIAVGFMNIGIGMFVNELFEMAVGYDKSFGFGGEYIGTDKFGKNYFSEPISFSRGVAEIAREAFSLGDYYSDFDANEDFAKHEIMDANLDYEYGMANMGSTEFASIVGSNVSTFGAFKALEAKLGLDTFDTGNISGFDSYNQAMSAGFDHYTSEAISGYDSPSTGYTGQQAENQNESAMDALGMGPSGLGW